MDQVSLLQRAVGNRATAHALAASPAWLQRDPDPNPNQSILQPSATWTRLNSAYSSAIKKLNQLNFSSPSRTRLRWKEELQAEWDNISQSRNATDDALASAEFSYNMYMKDIQMQAGQARTAWADLQSPYFVEIERLKGDANLGPKATEILSAQYNETAHRVADAGDFLAHEDLDGLRDMLAKGLHQAKAGEVLAKEDAEAKAKAEREIAAKLNLDELSNQELASQINSLQAQMATIDPESVEFWMMSIHLPYLRKELARREGRPYEETGEAYPSDIAMFSSYLIRGGYIQSLTKLLPEAWAKMTQSELTAFLASQYTEEQLKTMYLEKYAARMDIKSRFRKLNIISALVTGLIWARENIAEGEWGVAAGKVAAAGATAYVFNKLLYARDKTAAEIMAAKGAEYGRWFQGAARSNRFVNFLTRNVAKGLLIWDLKDFLMSGGGGGPNIPFDIIETVDINDPSTWEPPNQTLLNMGFNIWYRQACTEATPEACGPDLYLGKVEGSILGGLGRAIEMLPHGVESLRDNLYRIEGEYSRVDLFVIGWASRTVSPDENILVISTGIRSGEMVSGKFGHYHKVEVFPANLSAANFLGGVKPTMVPDYVLKQFTPYVPGKSQ
jgi:hypothetical protein